MLFSLKRRRRPTTTSANQLQQLKPWKKEDLYVRNVMLKLQEIYVVWLKYQNYDIDLVACLGVVLQTL